MTDGLLELCAERKTRTDAWWNQLTEMQQAVTAERMRKFPWHAVAPWVQEEFGIKAPSRAALYRFREWWDEHEEEYSLRQRMKDHAALDRELTQVGAVDAGKLAQVLANDIAAARAKGDDQAVARALRMYRVVAADVKGRLELQIKAQAEARQRDGLELAKREFEQRLRTDVERGLQALFDQVRGNAAAERIVRELQGIVGAAT